MLGQHEKVHEQMILSVDAHLDGLPVPLPPQPWFDLHLGHV